MGNPGGSLARLAGLAGADALASSTLLSDYDYLREISGVSSVTTVPVAGGYGVLFTGSSGVRFVVPDAASDAGWAQESLPDGPSSNLVTGVCGADGTVAAVAVGPDGPGPDILISARTAPAQWSGWAPVAVGDEVPSGSAVTGLITATAHGQSEIIVTLADGSGWRLDPALGAQGWHSIGPLAAGLVAGAVVAGVPGVVTVVPDTANPTLYDLVFYARPYGGGARRLAQGVSLTALTAAEQADSDSLVFIADKGYMSGTTQVSSLNCADPGAGLQVIDAGRTVVAEMAALAATAASPATLFATDTVHGRLHVWRPGISDPGQGLFDLGMPLSSLTPAGGADGLPELVGVDAAARRLHRRWQSPAVGDTPTDAGEWESAEIELPAGQLETRYAHSTLFTLTNTDGVPLGDASVLVYADGLVSLEAGGVTGMAGPQAPLATTTDAGGRVRVTVPTERFSTRKLVVLPAGHPGSALPAVADWFAPDERAMKRMRTLTAADLAPLVPDPANREPVQNALSRIGTANYTDLASPPSAPDTEPWQFTVDATGARFRTLTADEQARHQAVSRLQVAPGGLFDFIDDAFEAIAEAVETAITYTVSAVADGLSMAIDMIIDGVHWAVGATITAVEEGIAAAQAVLAIAGTTFDRIVGFFGWLLGDAKADIWRTKAYFEDLLTGGLSKLAGYAGQAQAASDTLFAGLENTVRSNWDELLSAVGSRPFDDAGPQAIAGTSDVQDVLDDLGSLASWLIDKLIAGNGGFTPDFAVPTALPGQVNDFAQHVTTEVVDRVQDSASAFLDDIGKHASSSQSLGELTLKTVLSLAEESILGVLGVADALTHETLTLVQEALTEAARVLSAPVGPGLAQDLADLMNPEGSEPVSLAGLTALMAAVPATILYKAIYGGVPFPPQGAESGAALVDGTLARRLSGTLMVPWTAVDLYLDLRSAVPVQPEAPSADLRAVNAVFACMFPALIQVLMFPGGFQEEPDTSTAAAVTEVTAWCGAMLPPMFNLIASLATGFEKTARHKDLVGVLFGFGLGALAGNVANLITQTVEGKAEWTDFANGIATPLPAIAKPLALSKPTGLIVLAVIDVVCDLCAAFARVAHSLSHRGRETRNEQQRPDTPDLREPAGQRPQRDKFHL
jgi:hypothetical protein